jgi:hypothetical protein
MLKPRIKDKNILAMQTLHKIIYNFSGATAIFRVPTERRGDAYLRVDRSNYENEMRAVVEVDAARFLDLWRQPNSGRKDVAHGTPSTWPDHNKFQDAEDGFKEGEENPVPLAEVYCFMKELERKAWLKQLSLLRKFFNVESSTVPVLGFTNGVTRTIWLLTAGATVFPVECSKRQAPLLHELAGIAGGRFKMVDELVPSKPIFDITPS